MIELNDIMMQHFLLGVILNIVFIHILINKLIIVGILSKFNLSTKGSNNKFTKYI